MSQENGPSKYNPFNWNFFRTPAPVAQNQTAPEQTTNPDAMEGVVETGPVVEIQPAQTQEVAPTRPSLMRRMSQRTLEGLDYARQGTVDFVQNNAYPIGGGLISTAGIMAADYFRQQNPVTAGVFTLATLATSVVTVPTAIGGTKLFTKAKDAIKERLAKKKRTADEAQLTDAVQLQAEVQSGANPDVADEPTQAVPSVDDLAALALQGQQPIPTVDDLAALAMQGQQTAPVLNIDTLAATAVPTFTPVADVVVNEGADDSATHTSKRQKRTKRSDVSSKVSESEVAAEQSKEDKKPASRRGRKKK